MSLPTLYEYYTSGGIDTGLSTNNTYFTLNNKNITLFSGSMNYFRTPPEHWRDRLKKLKAAGLNTVSTYIPWNLHEPQPGVYDFGDGGTDFQDFLNIEKFLKTAQEEELFAIVRPGPYICAEWEFGGFPSWLLRDKGIKLRSNDNKYMKHVERYFKVLFAILSVFQFTKGGPIIGFQIENEFGNTLHGDRDYLDHLKKLFLKYGLKEQFFTADWPILGSNGQIPGALYGANFKDFTQFNLGLLQAYQPGKPSMVMEFWSGWFDHWTSEHYDIDVQEFAKNLRDILKYPSSVNFYMFDGGTNFGFMAGANINIISINGGGYLPATSSYDYGAPLNEIGDYTQKYYEVKKIIAEFNEVKVYIPPIPVLNITRIKFANIKITSMLTLNDLIKKVPEKINSQNVIPMELLPINNNTGQSYGYIIYRKAGIDIKRNSQLKIEGRVFDTVMVLINGQLKSKIVEGQNDVNDFGFWNKINGVLDFGDEEFLNATLDLVVENCGRIHFGDFIQHKGLWQGNVLLNWDVIKDWQVIPLEFKKKWTNSLTNWRKAEKRVGPTLYKAQLQVAKPVDTFINMEDWKRGIVIVNGFVLSRYFWLGPQQTMYLPVSILKKGANDILVFEHFRSPGVVKFSSNSFFKTISKW